MSTDTMKAQSLGELADKVVIANATGNEQLFLAAINELIAGVRYLVAADESAEQATVKDSLTVQPRAELLTEFDRGYLAGHKMATDEASIKQALQELSDSTQEIETTENARRYRFLMYDFSAASLDINGNHSWVYRRNFSLSGPTLDAAIDAAMSSTTIHEKTP